MNNTIDNSNIIKTVINDTKKPVNGGTKDSNHAKPMPSSINQADTVSITDAAKKLAQKEKLSSENMPIHDNDKLNGIKQEIENGTYTIDSKAIAQKLMEFE